MSFKIWEFHTKNFTVVMTAEPEHDVDLSWDGSGEVAGKINDGTYEVFCAKCTVLYRGAEIASDYLGQCIYANVSEFRDRIGCKAGGYGSYFSDMVRAAVTKARLALCDMPKLRCAVN